jgi:hypothetical protein
MTLNTPEAQTSESVEISLDEAKGLLSRAVEEKGDLYTYEQVDNQCLYFNPETKAPSCLVGHVLAYKGITFDGLDASEANNSTDVHDLVEAGVIRTNLETEYLLSLAQDQQDSGATWGRALKTALEDYEERTKEAIEESEDHDDPSEDYYF